MDRRAAGGSRDDHRRRVPEVGAGARVTRPGHAAEGPPAPRPEVDLLPTGIRPDDLQQQPLQQDARRARAASVDGRRPGRDSPARSAQALAALDHPRVGGVFYGDLDSYYDGEGDDVAALHADSSVDYAAFTNSGPQHAFWNVKGCAFYARDAPLPKRLLEAWLRDRCGFKDQYPYWHSILVEGARAGCLAYDGEIYRMLSYEAMKKGAATYPSLDVAAGALRQKCPAFRFRPHKFARPLHRSVGPDAVVGFSYAAAGAVHAMNVSNALANTPAGGDLLGALGLAGVDAAAYS